ncbi:MAG TPA: VOC family protein [Gemmatimonadaceae bacterium]
MAATSVPATLRLTRLTPVLVVDAVEPCVAFWTDRLGFTLENQVPGPDGKLVFASVRQEAIEVMYQTRQSVIEERPDAASELTGHSTALFITVDDLDAVEKAVAGVPVVSPRHTTFYGSAELYVREPGGNTVGFAKFG